MLSDRPIIAMIGATLLLTAPGFALGCEPGPPQGEPGVFEGEIVFRNEFNLYPHKRGSAREKECISGTFPRKLQDWAEGNSPGNGSASAAGWQNRIR